MSRVVVVTDSSTCLPSTLVESLGIHVLPISVHLPDGDVAVGLDGGADWELTDAVALEELSGANHPFVTEYLEAIERPGYDAAIVITPAVEFAAMYRNAALAAELATRPSVAIDTRTAAAGQALVVLAGAEAAATGAELDEVVRVGEDASRRVELVAALANLEPIRRSVPLAADVLGAEDAEDSRSVFRMRAGAVEPIDAGGTAAGAVAAIVEAYTASTARGVERATVFHAGLPDLAANLADELGGVDFVCGFSLAMQIHTGSGVLGAAWLPVGA